MLFLLLVVFCLTLFSVAAGPPKSCNAITATKIDNYYGSSYSTTTVSLDLKLFKFGNTTWIYVSNFSYNDTSSDAMPDIICANTPYGIIDAGDPQKCSPTYNTTFAFSIQEPSFYLHAHFANYLYEVYSGEADDGTFSFGGSMFTLENSSYSFTITNRNYALTETQTCTSFVAAPAVEKAAPKCKSFESETVVLNSDNSVNATSNGTYKFYSGNNMTVAANFSGYADGYFVMFWVNGGEACESKYKQCNIELDSGDLKIIISSAIVKQNGTEYFGNAVPMIGRIVVRGNQTLMEEGTPFSPSDSCLSTSYKFGDKQTVNNKFCCTEFEHA